MLFLGTLLTVDDLSLPLPYGLRKEILLSKAKRFLPSHNKAASNLGQFCQPGVASGQVQTRRNSGTGTCISQNWSVPTQVQTVPRFWQLVETVHEECSKAPGQKPQWRDWQFSNFLVRPGTGGGSIDKNWSKGWWRGFVTFYISFPSFYLKTSEIFWRKGILAKQNIW